MLHVAIPCGAFGAHFIFNYEICQGVFLIFSMPYSPEPTFFILNKVIVLRYLAFVKIK